MKIYALTFEYSYPNNLEGVQSPDEAGGVIDLFEDEDDAQAAMKAAEESGDWGDFSDEAVVEENCGWSTQGFILGVEGRDVIPSSKRKS